MTDPKKSNPRERSGDKPSRSKTSSDLNRNRDSYDGSLVHPLSLTTNNGASALPSPTVKCLLGAIEAEIIPRLMVAYQDGRAVIDASGGFEIDEKDVHDFTDIVLGPESATCLPFVEAIRDRGVPIESIYLHLLAPAAQSLGAMWASDACGFTQITIALWRMQQVMYSLSPGFHAGAANIAAGNRNIMLTPVPGSQHTFGIQMVAEFFKRAGWSVWCEPACDRANLLQELGRQWFEVAGISVGSQVQLAGLEQLIDELRDASKNKSMAVLLGGPIFAQQPDLAAAFHADGIAIDAESAVEKAESLVALRMPRLDHSKVLRVG